jgi:hypothetical protein
VRDLREPYEVGRLHGRAGRAPARARARSWTQAQIRDAIREWVARHGDIPTVADLEPSRARRAGQEWRARRFEAGHWPSAAVIKREFGTLSVAIRSAGFRPRPAPTRRRPKLRSETEILEAIREWTSRYGEPPAMADWEPSRARRAGHLWRVERYQRGDWPSARSVRNHFGSFSSAVREAGLVPRPRGQRQGEAHAWRARNRELLEERRQSHRTGFGPAVLATRVQAIMRAREEGDGSVLQDALVDLAATSLRWADHIALSASARTLSYSD